MGASKNFAPPVGGGSENFAPREGGPPKNLRVHEPSDVNSVTSRRVFCFVSIQTFQYFKLSDHKSGDYERSSHKKKWAIGCVVFSLFMGLCVIIGVLLVVFVFASVTCK